MSKMSPIDLSNTLTGHEEMAITQHFGVPVSQLMDEDPSMWGRALVFVLRRRDGANDDDARNEVMDMSVTTMTSFFASKSEESGKESAVNDEPPPTSPPSASEPDGARPSTSS